MRQVSPVALAETFLDRLRTLGPRYNAVVTLTPELALTQARRAEQELAAGTWRGPLHGIPYGLKDLFATAGIPTSWGAAPFRRQVFDYDATVVRRLEQAGAVLVAKLAMVELAGGLGYRQPNASFTGPGINPWDESTWSGGSSSGSGSAVAAGLVPFAIGTETNGSIISPAANCGIAGLRPSYGRVSRRGGMPLAWSLDKPGPMALTADDCGIVLEAIAGFDAADPTTTRRTFSYSPAAPERRFRLAWPEGATDDAEPAVRDNFAAALAVLGEIADIEPVTLPDYPYDAVISAIMLSESASIFAELARSGRSAEMTAPEDAGGRLPARTAHPPAAGTRSGPPPGTLRRTGGAVATRRRIRPRRVLVPGQDTVSGREKACALSDQRRRQLRRPAGDLRPQRFLGRRAADRHSVRGPGLRRARHPCRRRRISSAHELAPEPSCRLPFMRLEESRRLFATAMGSYIIT